MLCHKDGAKFEKKPISYFGTVSYTADYKSRLDPSAYWYFCDGQCFDSWWRDLTWHLDTLDERMNVNRHFERVNGLIGTYKGKKAHASWNGLEARHFLGEYEFENRKPHPLTCGGCSIYC